MLHFRQGFVLWDKALFFLDAVFLTLLSLCVQHYQEHRFHLSVGLWEVGEERSNTCGRNPRHTPYGTGTLLTEAITAWAPCSSSRDGQQACGRHSYGLRMVCPRRDGFGEKSPCSFFFCYMRRYGMYGIYTPSKVRKCRISRNVYFILFYFVLLNLFIVHPLSSGTCFLPCKGTSFVQDGLGFHSENIGNLPFFCWH